MSEEAKKATVIMPGSTPEEILAAVVIYPNWD